MKLINLKKETFYMTLMFNLLVLVGEIKKRGFNQNLVMNLIIILKLIRILFKKVKFLRLLTTKTLQLVYKIKTYLNLNFLITKTSRSLKR